MNKENIPDMILERYILDELPVDRKTEVEEIIRNNSHIEKRLTELKISNKEILEKYPAEVYSKIVENRYDKNRDNFKTKQGRSFLGRLTFGIGALAAAAVIVLLLVPAVIEKGNIYDYWFPETTRIKGIDKKLFIYRKSGDTAHLLKNGARVSEYDLLQIAYRIDKEAYGVILSIDGNGTITLQFPKNRGMSTKLIPNKKVYLPESYELDNAPGFERFFLIMSKNKIDIDRVMERVKQFTKSGSRGKFGRIFDKSDFEEISITLIK